MSIIYNRGIQKRIPLKNGLKESFEVKEFNSFDSALANIAKLNDTDFNEVTISYRADDNNFIEVQKTADSKYYLTIVKDGKALFKPFRKPFHSLQEVKNKIMSFYKTEGLNMIQNKIPKLNEDIDDADWVRNAAEISYYGSYNPEDWVDKEPKHEIRIKWKATFKRDDGSTYEEERLFEEDDDEDYVRQVFWENSEEGDEIIKLEDLEEVDYEIDEGWAKNFMDKRVPIFIKPSDKKEVKEDCEEDITKSVFEDLDDEDPEIEIEDNFDSESYINSKMSELDTDEERYTLIKSKSVEDADGFYTDYTMYKDNVTGNFVFIFGDNEVYTPENESPDYVAKTAKEAYDWFDNYEGFAEEMDEAFNEFAELDKKKEALEVKDELVLDESLISDLYSEIKSAYPMVEIKQYSNYDKIGSGLIGGTLDQSILIKKSSIPNMDRFTKFLEHLFKKYFNKTDRAKIFYNDRPWDSNKDYIMIAWGAGGSTRDIASQRVRDDSIDWYHGYEEMDESWDEHRDDDLLDLSDEDANYWSMQRDEDERREREEQEYLQFIKDEEDRMDESIDPIRTIKGIELMALEDDFDNLDEFKDYINSFNLELLKVDEPNSKVGQYNYLIDIEGKRSDIITFFKEIDIPIRDFRDQLNESAYTDYVDFLNKVESHFRRYINSIERNVAHGMRYKYWEIQPDKDKDLLLKWTTQDDFNREEAENFADVIEEVMEGIADTLEKDFTYNLIIISRDGKDYGYYSTLNESLNNAEKEPLRIYDYLGLKKNTAKEFVPGRYDLYFFIEDNDEANYYNTQYFKSFYEFRNKIIDMVNNHPNFSDFCCAEFSKENTKNESLNEEFVDTVRLRLLIDDELSDMEFKFDNDGYELELLDKVADNIMFNNDLYDYPELVKDTVEERYKYYASLKKKDESFIEDPSDGWEEGKEGWEEESIYSKLKKKFGKKNLKEASMSDLDAEIRDSEGIDKLIYKTERNVKALEDEIHFLTTQAPREIQRGGAFDSQEEIDEALYETRKALDKEKAKLRVLKGAIN